MVVFIKKVIFLTILILAIISSGCIKGTEDNTDHTINQSINSLVIVSDLPEGYEFLGIYPDFSEYDNDYENIINSGEGIYKDQNYNDVYIDIIEFDTESNAILFIEEYKSRKNETLFEILTINGHTATMMKTYSISKGIQEPRYSFFWNDNNYAYIVKSNSNDENSALNVVKALI